MYLTKKKTTVKLTYTAYNNKRKINGNKAN